MSRIYIGNLPIDIKESELDDLFYKYGRIREIDLKTPARPPAFAFVSFEDYRDAEDAVQGRDGYMFDGSRLRVEFAKGDRASSRGGDRRDERGTGRQPRRSDYGVVVTNLPKGTSWQDLKDFMRKAGDVVYTEVSRDGDGVVEFSNRDDMDYAIKSMDDTEFRGHNDNTFIRLKKVGGGKERSESRGRSPPRGRSRSRTPPRDRSRSRDRSSADRKRSYSRSPSRSRSPKRDADGDVDKKGKDDDKGKDKEKDEDKEKEKEEPVAVVDEGN